MSDRGMTVVSRNDELLTVQQVANWLKVEPRYVYRLASSGFHLRVYVGRYVRIPAASNPREVMARIGHDSPRAALICMHSSDRRQRTLADAVAKAARAELAKSKKGKAAKPSGHLAGEWLSPSG